MIYLTAAQVVFLHDRLTAETGGASGVRDVSMLAAAVARPRASFADEDLYTNLFRQAAALAESIIVNHPFVDGNKRTGIAAAGLFMLRNGRTLTATNRELERIALGIASGEAEFEAIAEWLEQNSRAR